MFKECKPGASSSGARLTSPLIRRRPHTSSSMYMSPQTVRKNSGRSFGKLKKKPSAPDGLGSPPAGIDRSIAFNAFCEDPKNVQITEHVSVVCVILHVHCML